jgi:hypothetical protein
MLELGDKTLEELIRAQCCFQCLNAPLSKEHLTGNDCRSFATYYENGTQK